MTKTVATGHAATAMMGSGLEATLAAPARMPRGTSGFAPIDPRRYVVRRELARGGMGRISIADDLQLGRTVALKEVLSPHGPLAARFARELALTSRLQHPSIVSVHDGGIWPSGELVYVMKLVQGEPLDKVIARTTTVADRIALLPHGIAICEAIAYAHAQGILHRDLKPANVLVGDYGETVVIDWGLAKDLHDARPTEPTASTPYRALAHHAETVDGDVMGTPAYMPPEQANGDPVDARADVYALGAVLYHVLAGAAPYTGKTAVDVLDAVLDHPPALLADRAPGIPRELVTIVDKAMARRPEDRYASAGELAADLRRFQTGQLVGAHRYSTTQLIRRWVRKHRTAVSVAALATLLLALVGALSIRRIVAEERQAEAARVRAEHNRALAERNSEDAEGLTTFMLANLRDRLLPLGKQDLLAEVATHVQAYYRHQPEARGAKAQHGRANAYRNLGDVLLAQGDTAGALEQYRAEQALLFSLLITAPTEPSLLRDLGVSHVKIGRVLATRGDLESALAASDLGTTTLARVAATEHTALAERELSNAYDTAADLLAAQGDPRALDRYRDALSLVQRAGARDPADSSTQRAISISLNKIGDVLLATDDIPGALEHYRASLAVIQTLVARDATNTLWQRDLSISHARIGDVLLPAGDVPNALTEYQQALDIALALAKTDPTNADWQLDLAICHDNVGDALQTTGDLDGALAHFTAAMTIKERQRAQDPANTTYARNLRVGDNRLGDALLARKETRAALTHYTRSLAIAAELAAAAPLALDARRDRARAHDRVGNAQLAARDATSALAHYRAELDLRDAAAAGAVDRPDLQRGRWIARHRIGTALLALHRRAEARTMLRSALAFATTDADRAATRALLR